MKTIAVLTDLEREGSIPIQCEMFMRDGYVFLEYPDERKGWILEVPVEILKTLLMDDDLK